MGFDFFYEGEEDDFSFIRIPKALFSNPLYAELSNDARMLYGLILDRMTLSRKNGWTDETGRIYIVFTMKAIEKEFGQVLYHLRSQHDGIQHAYQKHFHRYSMVLTDHVNEACVLW